MELKMDSYSVLLRAIDEGKLDPVVAVQMLQGYIGQEDMDELIDNEGIRFLLGEEDMGDGEYDGQPDEMQEWHDFDPDC